MTQRLAGQGIAALIIWLCWATALQAAATLTLGASDEQYSLGGALEYLEDSSGLLSIEEVSREPYSNRFTVHANGQPNFGSSRSAFWFRFSALAPANTETRWYLNIDFPALDLVELYVVDSHGISRPLRTGDSMPFYQRPIKVPSHLLQLPLQAGKSSTVLLRVVSSGSITVPMTVYGEAALREYLSLSMLGAGVFFGCLLALGIYNMLLFVSVRDRSYFYYSIATVCFVLVYLANFGIAYQYLWPDSPLWNNRSPLTLASIAMGSTVPFTRAFLHTRFNAPLLDKLLVVSGIACVTLAVLNLGVAPYSVVFRAFSFMLLIQVVLILSAGIVCMRRGDPLARFFLLAWVPLILAALAYVGRAFTLLPPHFLTIYGFQVGSALEMILLSFALAYRITQARRDKELAQDALLKTLRESERTLEDRVQLRTQELNATNAALETEVAERRRAEERLVQLAHHDALTGLPNRALLKERFIVAVSHARRHSKMVGVLLLDLDGFKLVNDSYGHDMGDALLVAVGQLLQKLVRDSDTVARLGGDEFVVLLGEMTEEASAGEVAEKILAALAEPLRVSDERSLHAGASIGIGIYPLDGAELEVILRRADSAMYQAKGAGRMCYRYSSAPPGSKAVRMSAMQPPGGATRTSGQ